MLLPETVDEHTGGDGFFRIGDGVGKLAAAGALVPDGAVRRVRGENCQKTARDFGPLVLGFTADEDLETLGEKLVLPPWLEPQRAEIEEGLPELRYLEGERRN